MGEAERFLFRLRHGFVIRVEEFQVSCCKIPINSYDSVVFTAPLAEGGATGFI